MEMLSDRNDNGNAARNEVGDLEIWHKRVCGMQNNEWLHNYTETPRSGVAPDTSLHVLLSKLDYSSFEIFVFL